MVTVRNWQDVDPYVGHETAIIWPIFRAESEAEKTRNHEDDALFITRGISGFTRHLMQPGKSGDYHDHEKIEQVYYIVSGQGKMKLDGDIYPIRPGDTVHIPPKVKHQLINDGDDWIEHLLVSAPVH